MGQKWVFSFAPREEGYWYLKVPSPFINQPKRAHVSTYGYINVFGHTSPGGDVGWRSEVIGGQIAKLGGFKSLLPRRPKTG